MQKLKVCFIGLGSIAKRHIKNLAAICKTDSIELMIDVFRHRETYDNSRKLGIENIYYKFENMPDDYDIIFITNPTEMHYDTLKMFHNKAKNFFIEKPICTPNQISDMKSYDFSKEKLYYVACPLRYNQVIQYIYQNIDIKSVLSIRAISSSYLPDWRPETDYRNTYSAHKDKGGGVSIDLIHEWDYLTYIFGYPQKVYSLIGKKSKLDIDSDDYAIYIAEYFDKILELHLDYFGRKTVRRIELITSDDTIVGDIINSNIRYQRLGRSISFNEERDDYQKRELRYFIDLINGNNKNENYIVRALDVLMLATGDVN